MLRGSSVLLSRSVKHYVPLINAIAEVPTVVWDIDANDYSPGTCAHLRDTAERIRRAVHEPNRRPASDTLVTKIMLGVFGCVPAFDRSFVRGLGVRFGPKALRRVQLFYEEHSEIIESSRPTTLDFDTGRPTGLKYSRAKVIDMVLSVEGARPGGAVPA